MPTLGIVMFTNAPPDRVAVVLERPRRHASRIVLAVDDRVDPAHDRAYQALADVVYRVPFPEWLERGLAWLVRQCDTDWILHLDGDEVLSAALADELPGVVGDGSITHAWCQRRWLYPDARSYLDIWPWRPDYQLRLYRNDHAIVRFPGVLHEPVEVLGPARYLTAPLYHADLVLAPTEQRRAKVARYDELRPDLEAPLGGRDFPSAYYLPELRPDTRWLPVPEADLAVTAALVAPPPLRAPRRRRAKVVATATIGDVDYWWEMRGLEPVDARAGIRILDDPITCYCATGATVDVEITNLGRLVWRRSIERRPPHIRIVSRWHGPDGEIADCARATLLPCDLPPGASEVVPVAVYPPATPGRYTLGIDVAAGMEPFGGEHRVETDVRPVPVLTGPDTPVTASAEDEETSTSP